MTKLTTEIIDRAIEREGVDADGYVKLGVIRDLVGQQTQYLAYYFKDYPLDSAIILDEGLRTRHVENGDYHSIKIHREDVLEFLKRYDAQVHLALRSSNSLF